MTSIAAAQLHIAAPRGLHIALWAVQGLLALAFGMAGFMKLTVPLADLTTQMPWVSGSMGAFVRYIGAVELLGAIGLILPSLTRIRPRLGALAALGLATVMVLASATHLARGEAQILPVNLILGAMAAFVAWGRGLRAPIAARAA